MEQYIYDMSVYIYIYEYILFLYKNQLCLGIWCLTIYFLNV